MDQKQVSIILVIQLLLASWVAIGIASAVGEPTTTISIQTPSAAAGTGQVYVSQNPVFSLAATPAGNGSILYTEYEITKDGQTTTANYTSAVTVSANYSTDIGLKYRSNSTTALESWNDLMLKVDADPPSLSLSSNGGLPLRYNSNQSVFVTSTQYPLKISCADVRSGVDNISGQIGNTALFGVNETLLLSTSTLPLGINGTVPFTIDISCKDRVDNYVNHTYSVIIDDSIPTLSIQEKGVRSGSCISGSWWIAAQANDNHTDSNVERLNSSTWNEINGSVGVSSNFNGSIYLRANDSTGQQSTNRSWTVAVDSTPPMISASLNQSTLTANSTDYCGVSSIEFRWETLTGQTFGWTTLQGTNASIPSSLNGSIIRAQVRSTDVIGNIATATTSWVNTNGSSPFSSVSIQSDRVGSTISGDASFLITPVGYQAVANWEIFINSNSDSTGNSSSQFTLNNTFVHGDNIQFVINTSDGLGDYSVHYWNYTVDSSNSHQIPISVTGQYQNNSILILGPTGRIVPAAASDDSSGVGGSHASCSWDGTSWFQSSSSAVYAPSTASGAVQSYIFACRSVDLLGNMGPISWFNGSVDLQNPSLSLQPNTGETIGLGSAITVNMSDSNGINSGIIHLSWTNGTSTSYSNVSLGVSNWSSTLGQLFTGLSDGTITANVYANDSVGNSQSIIGQTWNLNTSNPYISVAISGEYNGQFITNDSTDITLIPPSGGWNGLWINYSLTNSLGISVLSGNVSASTTLQPTSLLEGTVWLNTTTGDSLGRIQNQGWIYTVDSSNSQSPNIEIIGTNITINNVTWIGVGSQYYVTGVNDDTLGVGANYASCSWDESSWFNVGDSSSLTPSISPGTTQNHTLSCMNVDILGNIGPTVQLSVSSDSAPPNQSLSPSSGSYVAPNSLLSVETSDISGIQYSRLNISWTNGQNSWQQSVMIYTNNWSSSLSSLQSNLADGTITVSLYTLDNLGNEEIISGQIWHLNTSQPLTSVSLSGSFYGTYVDENNFNIHLSPPTSGNANGWAIYTLEHSNGSIITSGNASDITQISQSSLLENGQIWLNVTSYDVFMRNQSQSWSYSVDTNVGTVPAYTVSGSAINQTGSPILGSSGRLSITTLQDDVGGVGLSHARCTWDGSNWFNTNNNSVLTPNSTSGSVLSYTLGCSVVDLLGNIGSVEWINGSVDLRNPIVSYSISSGSLLSHNSTFVVSCSDSSGCSLSQINAVFTNGSTTTWHSISISGTSSGVSLSLLLNASSSGTVTFYTIANDQLGNTINQSSSSFQYLYDIPTITTSITSTHSGFYIDGNLSITLTPSSGWMTGIYVNLSIEHSANSSALFTGALNQTLASQSLSNLSEGQIWINSTICDLLNRCSNSTVQLFVDNTAPSNPSYSITNGHVLSNQSHIVQGSELISLNAGSDSASGLFQTICNGSNGIVEFDTSQTSVSIQSVVQFDDWSTIYCYSEDNVGNVGESIQFTIRRDDTTPTNSINDYSTSGVISPSGWYNASCTDNVLFDNQYLEISSGTSVLYQMNSSGSISIRYGTISSLGTGGQLGFELTCSDVAGNEQTDTRTLEWLPYLTPSTISVSGLQINGTLYVTDLDTVTLANSRIDIYHEYRYVINGTAGDWFTENSTSFNLDLGPGNDSKNLRIQVRVLKIGTTLSNTSYSTLMRVDLIGPSVEIDSNPVVSNGSLIDLSSTYLGVGIDYYVWSWDNGSAIQSSNLSHVIIPSSASTSSWLSIKGVDLLGTEGSALGVSITRDVTPPLVTINNTHVGYVGPETVVSIEIIESNGLSWSTIRINGTSGQSTLIASNVNSYQLTSTDYPAWIWNQSNVDLVIQTESNSGIFVSQSISLNPDNTAPTVSISEILSTNYYYQNTSNYSTIYLSRSSDTSLICVKVGNNYSSALATNCLTETANSYNFSRISGNYVLVANLSDFAGNNNITSFSMAHHSISSKLNSSIPSILRPGEVQYFSTTSAFPITVDLFWNGNQILNQGGWFVVPSGSGLNNLTIDVIDPLGLSSSSQWNVTLDSDHPEISFEGEYYSNSNFGSNTTIHLNSSDTLSLIYSINLEISSGSHNCQRQWLPADSNFSISGTLEFILQNTNCSILQGKNLQVSINLTSEDYLGNIGNIVFNMIYHGSIENPTWDFDNSVHGNNSMWSSISSTHLCLQGAGTIVSSINISWSGSGGSITNNSITNLGSDGVISCYIEDIFGNNVSSQINISIDSTLPVLTVVWPASSSNGIIKSGGSIFNLLSIDNQTGILNMKYCLTTTICNPNTITTGAILVNITNGSGTLFASILNGAGMHTNLSINFTVDNTYPSITVGNNTNTSIENSYIYAGYSNPKISASLSDDLCIISGYYEWNNGNNSLSTNSQFALPANATWIRIYAVDCVGHTTSSYYTIHRINNIQNISVNAASNDTGNVIFQPSIIIHDGFISLVLDSNHPVELTLYCPVSQSFSCSNSGNQNVFLLQVSSNNTIEEITLGFTDNLGNSLNLTLYFSADITEPSCIDGQNVISNSTALILPSLRSSTFICTDDNSEISSAVWNDSGTLTSWTFSQNQTWIAPPPTSSPISIIITDNVGNVFTKTFQVNFDDSPPELLLSASDNSISFDEKMTRSDSEFTISCQDDSGLDCIINVTISDVADNSILLVQSFYNQGTINLPMPELDSTIRLEIEYIDAVGNIKTMSEIFEIDDYSPEIVAEVYSQITGELLPDGVISIDGQIVLQNYSNSDVNVSLSSNYHLNCSSNPVNYSGSVKQYFNLGDYNLMSCNEFTLSMIISDHVGNTVGINETFFIDHLVPTVIYSVDPTCSWNTGSHYDMQSTCLVNITIVDDLGDLLSPAFTLTIFENGEEVDVKYIVDSMDFNLSLYKNSSISITVSGSDQTGKEIISNNLNVKTQDEINPIWVGLICSGNIACTWDGEVTSASLNETIGVKTPYLRAPITEFYISFENAIDKYSFSENFFSSDLLPDGIYLVNSHFIDAAGREYNGDSLSMVFDNTAPEIIVLNSQSKGIINDTMILSCDVCMLTWVVNEISNYSTTINHEIYSSEMDQYALSTSILGLNQITFTAQDTFGRISTLNYSTVPIRATSISIVETVVSSSQIISQCVESAAEDELRQVNCLWKRKESKATTIPIQIEIDIDLPEFRDVKLIIYKSGGEIEIIDVDSGIITLPSINHYSNSVQIELLDDYSDIKNIEINLFEHTRAWSEITLSSPQLSEATNYSEFDLIISPPESEKEFHLLKRGLFEISDVFDCYSTYSFARHNEISASIDSQNCNFDSQSLIFLGNGSISVTVFIDHSGVRMESGPLPEHDSPLYNLEFFSLAITYNDSFGVFSKSSLRELYIDSDSIIRTRDVLPQLELSQQNVCPLGLTNLDLINSDGFLQSQRTSPLSECSKAIFDEDGIYLIIWKFTFIDGNERYESEFECLSTYFPLDWNFQDAIDTNFCSKPSNIFPSGVFQVIVRPLVVDEAIFVGDQGDYVITESGYYSKPILQGDCTYLIQECEFVQYELFNVVVSSSLNPISEVENSKALVESATVFVESWIFVFIIIFSVISLLVIAYNFYRKIKNASNLEGNQSNPDDRVELTADQVKYRFKWDEAVLQKIIQEYGISSEEREEFLLHGVQFDENFDGYLSRDELSLAAEEWFNNRYSRMTVVQLRELLKQKGLPVSGKKSELIAKLID